MYDALLYMYLGKANARVANTTMLDAMHIKYDSPELAKFALTHSDGWDDYRYDGTEYYMWGKDDAGATTLRRTVAIWIEHIKIGSLAANVLCEYIDSQIHCFDNKQRYHKSNTNEQEPDPLLRTNLALWQRDLFKHLQDDHVCEPGVILFDGLTPSEIRAQYTQIYKTPRSLIHARSRRIRFVLHIQMYIYVRFN